MRAKRKKNHGFTLVEMIVALAIFSVVIIINLAIIFTVSNAQKKAVALQNAQDNIRFAFESMTKEMRTGTGFSGGGGSITFTNHPQNETVVYSLSGTQIKRTANSVDKIITSRDVVIGNLDFTLIGAGSDGLQPKVTVVLQAQVNDPRNKGTAKVNLQTTISQIALDQ